MLLSIDLPVTDAVGVRGDSPRTEPSAGRADRSFTGVLNDFTAGSAKTRAAPTAARPAEPAGRGLPPRGKVLPSEPDVDDFALPLAGAGMVTVESLAGAIAQAVDLASLPSTVDQQALPAVGLTDAGLADQSLAEIATLSIQRLLGTDALSGLPLDTASPGEPAGVPLIEGVDTTPVARPGLPETIGQTIAAETGVTLVPATLPSAAATAVAPVVAEAIESKSASRGLERGMAVRPAVAAAPQPTPAGQDTVAARGASLELTPPSLVPPSFVPGDRAAEAKGSRTSEALTEAVVGRLFGGTQNVAMSSGPLFAHFGAQAPAAPSAPQATPVPGISVALQDPGFGQILGDRVLFMTDKSIPTAEIRMVPADLGPVTVSVVVDDGRAELTFAAHHPHTREAIELAMPRLREMLGDQGLTLGHASVTDSGAQRDRREDLPDDSKGAGVEGVGPAGPSPESRIDRLERAIKGLVDTFA